ncbi:thioredoxin domain-containing protein [Myroides sp. LJL119]
MPNQLIFETSPYLLQHAQNPVDWQPYNQQAFDKAQKQNKLLVISIGYSTCHWCHVMEKESFENKQVAQVMNTNFINIKVDREELPDVDNYYIKAVQLMTKQAGWPLNVVCLPDGRAIWGGTYFKTEHWIESLEQLQQLYQSNPEKVLEFAQKLDQGVSILSKGPVLDQSNRFNVELLVDKWAKSFDWEYGGYSKSPKFMMPNNLLYLQRLAVLNKDDKILQYIDLTLTKMAWGGIFDPIQGGFCRYSVDYKWHIPHFEKMLYDNAQLLSVYSDGYKRCENPLYKQVIQKTIDFITTCFSNKQGGYYSALDADSLNADSQLVEGAYYTWSKEELQEILQDDFYVFSQIFNINDFGYWDHEKQYVLIQDKPLQLIAEQNNITLESLIQKKKKWEELLEKHRKKRKPPHLDHKIITSWNAMLIQGLLDSYSALALDSYLQLAKQSFDFLYRELYDIDKGLYHSMTNQQTGPDAYMDDYAFFIQAALGLYQFTGETKYLHIAKKCCDVTLDYFWDQKSGFFFFSKSKNQAVLPSIETEDNVIVSCNSVMAKNLLQLGLLFENYHYTQIAKHMTQVVLSQIDYGSAYSNWLLVQLYIDNPSELVITGKDAVKKVLKLHRKIITRALIYPVTQPSQVPYLNKPMYDQKNAFYLCTQHNCLPVEFKETFLTKITL